MYHSEPKTFQVALTTMSLLQYLWPLFTAEKKTSDVQLIRHDGVVHDPLGAGSYVFQKRLTSHLMQYCASHRPIIINVGVQPNSVPHMGNIVTLAVAFILAQHIRDEDMEARNIQIILDIVDTAPSNQEEIEKTKYQRSQRHTGEMEDYIPEFKDVLEALQEYTSVPYQIRTQKEFLSHPDIPHVIGEIIQRREELGKSLAPETGRLAIRAACPVAGCGLADKHGMRNVYEEGKIRFHCPKHGEHTVDITLSADVSRLEFNTPLRNLVRALKAACDTDVTCIRVTGADYAGYYQEQLLWRHIARNPVLIFYSPLIVDWSGAKLSKSLYVREGAYKYLEEQNLDYMLSFKRFKEQGKNLQVIFEEVKDWVDHPYKLFRSYSIHYMASLFAS